MRASLRKIDCMAVRTVVDAAVRLVELSSAYNAHHVNGLIGDRELGQLAWLIVQNCDLVKDAAQLVRDTVSAGD